MCWYCYWGLPKPVHEIYQRGLEDVGESAMNYGPAHVVWADFNLDNGSIQACIEDCEQRLYGDFDATTFERVKQSLVELLAVPEEIRCPMPDNHDPNQPELFPPPAGLELVKE